MKRTIPEIVKPTSPIGADLAISDIQDRLATITYRVSSVTYNWFDTGLIFGLAIRDEKQNEPILYWKNKDYFKTFFDNYKSYCWFYESDPRDIEGRSHRFNFSLVVCYRQKMISRHTNYPIREWFIDAILSKVLDRVLSEEDFQTIQVFTDPNTVFNNYDIEKMNSIFKDDDYYCFRISFRHQGQIDCIDLNLNPVTSLDAPTSLTAVSDADSIVLTWTSNSGGLEDGFKIERSLTSGSGFTQIDTVGTTIETYDDTTAVPGTEYFYRVRAFNGAVNSDYSNEDNATIFVGDVVLNFSPPPFFFVDPKGHPEEITFTSGTNVDTVNDQGTGNNDLVNTSPPVYDAGDGKIRFSAVNQGLQVSSASAFNFLHDDTTQFTLGIVAEVESLSAGNLEAIIRTCGNSFTQTGLRITFDDRTGIGRIDRLQAFAAKGSSPAYYLLESNNIWTQDQIAYVELVYRLKGDAGDDVEVFFDNVSELTQTEITETANTANSTAPLTIGTSTVGSAFSFYQIFMFKRLLTAQENTDKETYLNSKYGFSF